MKRKSFALMVLVSLFTVAVPAFGTTACTAGSLATIEFSTCTIGPLTFTFQGLFTQNNMFAGGNFLYNSPWQASDFNFIPVANGFTLSFLPGAQTITAPTNAAGNDEAVLLYSVADSGGGIVGAFVSGGAGDFSSSGANGSAALNQSLLQGPPGDGFQDTNGVVDSNGSLITYNQFVFASSPFTPITSGNGKAFMFALSVNGGSSATWSGSDTTFTFALNNPPPPPSNPSVPEPGSLALFGSGLIGVAGALRRRILYRQ